MAAMTSELLLRLKDGLTGPAKIATGALNSLNKAVASSIGNKSGMGLQQAAAAMRKEAQEMRRAADAVGHSGHVLGSALAGLGLGHGFGEFMKAGAAYRDELIALKNSGKTTEEIARSIKAATALATELPTQTFTDSIKIINETTAAYGDLGHAIENLKFNSQFESNMKQVLGSAAGPHMLQDMVRALEIRGTAFNPEKYQDEAGKLGKAFAFSRGAVNPENFYDFAKNANPDIKGFSTQFLTEVVPSLIQTFSAPGAGTGIKALEKVWRGGLTDKSQAAEWVRVGMVSAKAVQDNKGQSPGWKSGNAAFSQLARENPLEAMGELLKKLQAIGVDIMDPNKLGPELDKLFKNGKARAMAYELGQAITRTALNKDARLIRGSASMDEQYANNMDSLPKAMEALHASFENLMTSMSGPLITTAAHGIWNLALGIQHTAQVLQSHPLLGGALGITASIGAGVAGIAILRSTLGFLGLSGIRPFKMISAAILSMRATALASAAFMGRSFLLMLNPLSLVRGAIFGVGVVLRGLLIGTGIGALIVAGGLIYQNWDNVRVAFEAFSGAFMRAIAPVRPILQPIIQDIGALWDMVSGLIQPTGDMGDKWAQIGIQVGTVLGQDLVPWAQSIRNAWDAVKGMGAAWSTIADVLTASDPIGHAVTLMIPKINAMAAELKQQLDQALTTFFTGWVKYAEQGAKAFLAYDWPGLGRQTVGLISNALLADVAAVGTALTDLAKAGWNAFVNYDWKGLGTAIVQKIIAGIEGMGSALADKLRSMVPSWVPGFGGDDHLHGGAGDDTLGGSSGNARIFRRPASAAGRAADHSIPEAYRSGVAAATGDLLGATAGIRARNLGNIGYFHQSTPGLIGPSNSRDVDHSIALFRSQEDGIRAAAALALRKYKMGRHNTWDLIAAKGGWTPGALGPGASVNVARAMGLSNRDDAHLDDPQQMRRFLRGLAIQEHGKAGEGYYTPGLIDRALGGSGDAAPKAPAKTSGLFRDIHVHVANAEGMNHRQLAGAIGDELHGHIHSAMAGNFADSSA